MKSMQGLWNKNYFLKFYLLTVKKSFDFKTILR